MSIRVYLKDGIKKWACYQKGQKIDEINGIVIYTENTRLYFVHNRTSEIPGFFQGFIEEITLLKVISVADICKRESGKYKLENASAVAEVESGDYKLSIRISKAMSIQEVNELYTAIRSGSIRPFISYEGKQSGLSKLELEQQLEDLNLKNDNLQRMYSELQSKFYQTSEDFSELQVKWEKACNEVLNLRRADEELKAKDLKFRQSINELINSLMDKRWRLFSGKQVQKMLRVLIVNQSL